ncbi:MAG: hypothetical protein ACOVOX_02265 [Burkholderiaceae bacterium]
MRANTVVAAVLGLVALAITAALIHSFNGFEAKRLAFVPEQWNAQRHSIAGSGDPGCILGPMTSDLLQSGQLRGLNKAQVLQLLGPPDSESSTAVAYAIGQCHGWGWHHSELVLTLSAAEIVSGVDVRRMQ